MGGNYKNNSHLKSLEIFFTCIWASEETFIQENIVNLSNDSEMILWHLKHKLPPPLNSQCRLTEASLWIYVDIKRGLPTPPPPGQGL